MTSHSTIFRFNIPKENEYVLLLAMHRLHGLSQIVTELNYYEKLEGEVRIILNTDQELSKSDLKKSLDNLVEMGCVVESSKIFYKSKVFLDQSNVNIDKHCVEIVMNKDKLTIYELRDEVLKVLDTGQLQSYLNVYISDYISVRDKLQKNDQIKKNEDNESISNEDHPDVKGVINVLNRTDI